MFSRKILYEIHIRHGATKSRATDCGLLCTHVQCNLVGSVVVFACGVPLRNVLLCCAVFLPCTVILYGKRAAADCGTSIQRKSVFRNCAGLLSSLAVCHCAILYRTAVVLCGTVAPLAIAARLELRVACVPVVFKYSIFPPAFSPHALFFFFPPQRCWWVHPAATAGKEGTWYRYLAHLMPYRYRSYRVFANAIPTIPTIPRYFRVSILPVPARLGISNVISSIPMMPTIPRYVYNSANCKWGWTELLRNYRSDHSSLLGNCLGMYSKTQRCAV